MINNRHSFNKILVKNEWKDLRVGNKLTFMLFEGEVRFIERVDLDWNDMNDDEADLETPIADDNAVVFKTDTRTVVGNIEDIQEEIITVDSGEQKIFIPLENHKDVKWKFLEGDVVTDDKFTLKIFSQLQSSFSYHLNA